ncbi:MAG: 1-acylglycerol-3-phosphate O-acyltransferase [Acholeplasmataceae bacterium]|nr:1-acylglycerol-3-phosphate O-acyltransferase [Acholeplasmataceae bacterium]
MLILCLSIVAFIATILYVFLVQYPAVIWWNIPLMFIGFWLFSFIVFVLFLIFIANLHSKKTRVIKPKGIYPFLIYHVAVFLRAIYNVKIVFEDQDKLPQDKKFLLVLNHQSMFDPIMLISKLPNYQFSFIVKDSLIRVPFVGRYLHAAGFLPIDRKNDRKALENILIGIKRLESGQSLAIFPEGTRSKGPKMGEFRSGAFKTALKAQAPIVVAIVDGFYKRRVRLPFVPAKVYIRIVEVLPYDTIKDLHTNDISQHIHDLMENSLKDAREKYLWLR